MDTGFCAMFPAAKAVVERLLFVGRCGLDLHDFRFRATNVGCTFREVENYGSLLNHFGFACDFNIKQHVKYA